MINRVLFAWLGAMAAWPFDFETKALVNFLSALHSIQQSLFSPLLQSARVGVETNASVYQLAMIFQQPLDAVIDAFPALLARGQRENQITIRLKIFTAQSQ